MVFHRAREAVLLLLGLPLPCKNQEVKTKYADMAELADAHGSGPCESDFMQVQVLLSAPNSKNPNLVPIGEGFGFFITIIIPNSAGQNQKEVVAK